MKAEKQIIEAQYTGDRFSVKKTCSGGMGEVFIAQRERDGKLYAIKTFIDKKVKSWDFLFDITQQFKWESQIWILIGKHKNVVQAHWFDLSLDYKPILIMENVINSRFGLTIHDWIHQQKKLNEPPDIVNTLHFIIQALTGLIYANKIIHEELNIPFIHRDIKPANLFISNDDLIKVSDFGLVKAFGISENIGGTPQYMPPEQWFGEELEEKTDIYAFGCVLYEMLCGKSPFDLTNSEKYEIFKYYSDEQKRKSHQIEVIKKKHFKNKPEPLVGASELLNEILLNCLDKNPKNRFSFIQLREELHTLYTKLTERKIDFNDDPELFTAEDWNNRGSGFSQLKILDKAVVCYNHAIRTAPDDARFYLNRGNAHFRSGNFQKAMNDFNRAIAIAPNFIETYLCKGSTLLKNDRYQEALNCYQEAEKIDPKEARIYWGKGLVYVNQNQFEKAIDALNRANIYNPRLAEVYLCLGNIFFIRKNYSKAKEFYNHAITINPLYLEAFCNLAKVYEVEEDVDRLREVHIKSKKLQSAVYRGFSLL